MASTSTIFAIIMVSFTPVSTLCILFNFIVVVCCRHHTIDLATCTLLLGRLGHACAVVILMATYSLENWAWSRSMCQAFVWLWISCWVLDVLTNLFFLAYNSTRIGHDKGNVRYHVFVLLMACWCLAILAGALTFFAASLFHNYEDASQTCMLGLSISENPILIGTMLLIIIAGLLIIVLTISVSAESRALALKFKLLEARVDCLRTPKIQNGDVTAETNAMELNGLSEGTSSNGNVNNSNNSASSRANNSTQRVYTWAYVDKQMRDMRHIHAAATATTILLNMVPQLVLYSIDIMSGTTCAYTHHILVAFGVIHSVVLPVTFCTAGIRYRETSEHLVKGIFGTAANTAARNSDPEQNVVFHIRDVTTDSTDTNVPESPHNDSTPASQTYKRGQLQVLSMRGEPFLAPSTVNNQKTEDDDSIEQESQQKINGLVAMTTITPLSANNEDSIGGTRNPCYEHDLSGVHGMDPDYVRSLSDGSVDYGDGYDSEEDWGSWDSDSETWSNLYDYSDIEEALDASANGSIAKLSPTMIGHRRRPSHVSQTGSHGRRRKLSSQTSWPPDTQSPRPKKGERKRSADRKRKRRSKRRGRRESKGLVSGLERTMNLGIASAMVSRDRKKAHTEQAHNESFNTGEVRGDKHIDSQRNNPTDGSENSAEPSNKHSPPVPPPPDIDSFLKRDEPREEQKSSINSGEDEQRQSVFASQLAAAALKLKHIPGQDGDVHQQPKIIRNVSATKVSRKASRCSSAKIDTNKILPNRPSVVAISKRNDPSRVESLSRRVKRQTANTDVERTGSKTSRRSSSSSKGGLPAMRKHSSGKPPSRSSAPVKEQARHLDPASSAPRPISAPNVDPALANMTLSQIMTNPFLKDMLRRSLESLDSLTDDQIAGHPNQSTDEGGCQTDLVLDMAGVCRRKSPSIITTSSSELSEISQPTNHQSKASEMAYYQIPNIDSDCRYRPRKPLRRGKQAFKVAAQTVIIQEFLKKAVRKPSLAAKPNNLQRTTSGSSWANDSDVVDV